MNTLKGKTLFVTGGSRGIGLTIALRAARDGANIAIVAKTAEPHPRLPGTIHTAARDIEAAGGKALALQCDIRDEAQLAAAVAETITRFGGIDICVCNASAIYLAGVLDTPMKRFDLMHQVNARGTFATAQACLPHLLKAKQPHILTLSPALNLNPRWLANHTAYTMSKYGMSLAMMGLAAEFGDRISVNALWPRTVIYTSALVMFEGAVKPEMCRKPEIVADAAHAIFNGTKYRGQFLSDEQVLTDTGVSDFASYAVMPGHPLQPDLFLDQPS